jgi:hypothetical protein
MPKSLKGGESQEEGSSIARQSFTLIQWTTEDLITMKKTTISVFLVLGLVLFTFAVGSAHLRPDVNFAAVQVPIGVDGIVDYAPDGNLNEWENVPSIFWVTQDDLVETVRNIGDPDASNLAVRVIVGWSPLNNQIIMMEDRFDDAFFGTFDGYQETIEFVIDTDHSADPKFFNVQDIGLDPDRYSGALTQNYRYQLWNEPPADLWLWGGAPWAAVPPYAGIGWSFDGDVNGGAGSLSMEMYMTAFDDLPNPSTGPDSPEVLFHNLVAGEIIGLGFALQDADDPENTRYGGYWTNGGDTELYIKATSLVDYTLLGWNADLWVVGDGPTAVQEDSWGRIKSTFAR